MTDKLRHKKFKKSITDDCIKNWKFCIGLFIVLIFNIIDKMYYRYMYLKTYAKFTFCIESQGHVSDESFLYYCMHLASKISSNGV